MTSNCHRDQYQVPGSFVNKIFKVTYYQNTKVMTKLMTSKTQKDAFIYFSFDAFVANIHNR